MVFIACLLGDQLIEIRGKTRKRRTNTHTLTHTQAHKQKRIDR